MMTEEEMRKTWCPHVRVKSVAYPDQPTFNRTTYDSEGRLHPDTRCIGSRCSQWQWENPSPEGEVRPRGQLSWVSTDRTYAVEPLRPSWMAATDWLWDDRRGCWIYGGQTSDRGYCGLARKS